MSGRLKGPKIGKDATMCMKSAFITGPPCKLKNAMQMILIPEVYHQMVGGHYW